MTRHPHDEDEREPVKTIPGESDSVAPPSSRDPEYLLQELETHQIELEMQNVALRQSQVEIEASRSRYADLYDFAPVGYFTFDEHGLILEVNLTGARLLGVERGRLLNKPFSRFVAPYSEKIFFEHHKKVLRTTARELCEIDIAKKDGTRITVSLESIASKDDKGRFTHCRSAASDITARKRAEEALKKAHDELEERVRDRTEALTKSEEIAREQKREIEAYYDTAPIGLCVLDTDLRYQRVNERLAEMNGIPAREHLGRSMREIVPAFADEAERLVRRIIETGEPVIDMEITGETLARPGAPPRTWIAGWYPLKDSSGKVVGVSVAVEEVTRQRQVEEQLRQVQKMEAIGTLAGGIAHDFNNILGAIVGFTEMAIDDVPDRPLVGKNLKNVLKSAMRARDLVKQILSFSRKTNHAKTLLSLSPIIDETVQLLRASIPVTIEIRVTITTTSDTVLAAPTEVQQVLMNLATNASLAMQGTGILEIGLADFGFVPDSPVPGLDVTPGEFIQLTVKDTGTGMSPQVIKRIFEPFFTTRGAGEGTGMGLAMVYGIVKDLQGTITVESEPGVGSTFRVLLPKAMTGTVTEVAEMPHIPGGDERILLVDDEEMLVEWGRAVLSRLGYMVTAVTDSVEALNIFSADPTLFDLVITDQTISRLTGADLAKELLAIRGDIPVILCTGHSETVSPEEAKEIGIRAFLVKPLTRRELAGAVRRPLDARLEA